MTTMMTTPAPVGPECFGRARQAADVAAAARGSTINGAVTPLPPYHSLNKNRPACVRKWGDARTCWVLGIWSKTENWGLAREWKVITVQLVVHLAVVDGSRRARAAARDGDARRVLGRLPSTATQELP